MGQVTQDVVDELRMARILRDGCDLPSVAPGIARNRHQSAKEICLEGTYLAGQALTNHHKVVVLPLGMRRFA